MASPSETWRAVMGDFRYEVSDLGRVRNGETGRVLVLGPHPMGYLTVRHLRPEASRLVHRLVARAFVPNPAHLPQVNHRNGDKRDNRAENLEWVTAAENIQHAIDSGLNSSRGETHHYARLTEAQARQALEMRAAGATLKAIAAAIGCTFSNVSAIVRGKSWRHLSRPS